jgi:D-cysteine desulfhydrase
MRQNLVADRLLNHRTWLLPSPITSLSVLESSRILVIRDDLIHGLWGGNKGRKLDALLPQLCSSADDILAFGGLQSAHLSAVSSATASLGARSHLLIRGERPKFSTGHHLMATQFASSITYVSRSEYSDRVAMVAHHKERLQRELGEKRRIAVIEEGAFDLYSILGIIRLVHWLSSSPNGLSPDKPHDVVIDSGTGTSAIGWGVAIALLKLPLWRVAGVMVAQQIDYYKQQEEKMMEMVKTSPEFRSFSLGATLPIDWVSRPRPRRFGSIIEGDVEMCRAVSRESGILVDPIWSLSAFEYANLLAERDILDKRVVIWHTGGSALTLQGLAQRYPEAFIR